MIYSRLKILFCLTVCLTVLFAPFLLEIFPGGEAYAMSKWFSQDRSNSGSAGQVKVARGGPESSPPVHPTPEPATILLFGAGAVGLAAFRKKFKKK